MDTPVPAKEIIRTIVERDLAPSLKRAGFKRSAFTFTRRAGSTGHFLQIQLSRWNQGSAGMFYVNVGVMFDQMRNGTIPAPKHAKYDDCQFMVRLERLAPEAPSQWTVDASTRVSEVSGRLAAHVLGDVVETLNGVSSLADFESTGWAKAIPWGFPAMYAYALHNDEEARALVASEAEYFADRGVTREALIQNYGFTRLQRQ